MVNILTIRHISNNLYIDITTYIIILISFLAGYFEIVFLTVLIITIHEMGHYITGCILGLNVSEIRIFMFGGITKLSENLNVKIYKEILMLIMGPITQIVFIYMMYKLHTYGYIGENTYEKIALINKTLLKFNLLPILPLDGGKLLNNVLDLVFSYNTSHIISITISIIALPIVLMIDYKLFTIIILLFLALNIKEEIKIHKYRLNKLLTERKLKNISFKKEINIKNIKEVKRNCAFKIRINGINLDEKAYLKTFYLISST